MPNNLLYLATLDSPVIQGPMKLLKTELTVNATVQNLPNGCNTYVKANPSVTGSKLAMPPAMPAYTPSTTAVSPVGGGNVPRPGDFFIIRNSHATNTLQLYQPDGTTTLGSAFANGAVLVICNSATSSTAGYEIIPLI